MDANPQETTLRFSMAEPPGAPAEKAANSAAIPVRMTVTRASDSVVCRDRRRAGRQAYTRLLDSIYDAVFITDLKGRVVDMNPRALDFFRLPPETRCGFSMLELISGADEDLLRQIMRHLRDHRFTLIEALCIRTDRTSFPAEIAVNRVDLGDNGQLSFFVRDITIRRQALARLEDANERLRAHDRARMEFISNVSHELRTPLTSMIYGVRNLLRGVAGPLAPETTAAVKRLESDCRRLLNTVNDILDMRLIEAGKLTLKPTLAPLSRLAKGCMDSLRLQASEKQQTLSIHAPDRGTFTLCDVHKMERVLINIIGNAIKFTKEGGHIQIAVHPSDDRPGYVRFTCDDDGDGIPAEHVHRVADRFFRVGEHVAGTGLGLAISREIIELHGGSIELRSPVPGSDRGTSVRVYLPITPPPVVLVVEDDPNVLELLAEDIERHGYQVRKARTAAEAIEAGESGEVGLIVLDIQLPDLDGAAVILRLRARPGQARLPVVAVSGAEPSGPIAEVLNRFRIPLLAKPWNCDDLMSRIGTAFFATASTT